MYRKSDWEYRIKEYNGDEFSPITYWSYSAVDFSNHEDAAEAAARLLTSNDPDYYHILEDEGIEMAIRSPEGEVKIMRVSGCPDFVYRAEEVEA